MSEPRRIRITHVHKDDGFYGDEKCIGITGVFEPERSLVRPGYFKGRFWRDGHHGELDFWYFLAIRYVKI